MRSTQNRELATRPVRQWLPQWRRQLLQVIGGQTISGVDCVQYAATDPTLTTTYDPNVDVVYPAGMGNAWLMDSSGLLEARVLIRHDFSGATSPLVSGWVYVPRGTRALTVASGPSAGTKLLCYLVTFAI